MAALAEQIAAFKEQLSEIRQAHGLSWAVMVDSQVKAAFPDFEKAADYAIVNFPSEQFLIRHTDEQIETVPFIFIEE